MPISTSVVNDEQKLELIFLDEGHFLDFKAIEIAPASLTKSVSAFANSSGGELYVGIDEQVGHVGRERIWRGFANEEAANGLIQAIEAMSPLGNHYALEFLTNASSSGKVVHLTIFKSRDILRASNSEVYVRRGAQKLRVEGEEALRRLHLDKGVTSFEDERLKVDPELVMSSVTMLDFMSRIVPNAEPVAWLAKQLLTSEGIPTVASVLLFAEEPQALLPKRSAIKLLRYRTRDEGERDYLAGQPITIEGPIYDLIYQAVDKCKEIIEEVKKLGIRGLEEISYPQEALHEIITNAVLHRDYSIAVDAQVRIFDNRIEIESPGRFPGHITPDNVLNEQFARNPKLVRLINKFPDAPNKDVGEGLNTAFEAMSKLRLKPPTIEERDNSVLIVLRHESLGSPEQLVMDYLASNDSINNPTGRDLTGIKSENTMKNVFYRLRDRGLLERVPGRYGIRAAWQKKR